MGSSPLSGIPAQPIHAPRRLRSSGSSAVTNPPGLRFHVVLPSGNRSMSMGSRLATTTKSELPEAALGPPSGLIYASVFEGPMPSMDRNIRHSSASAA
ncbi:hypothetical protein BN970_06096 [Mycolicibacterium conceptionense]|uniref:Uncharacterized protein n=1 Tax=Mycolicibacterium conceptionense TaxID=451644 RepID=A0A0U1DZG6_9MYCO|nr:hypothetical protein BN970_06096 [Mycolicibacterium conceptionense]